MAGEKKDMSEDDKKEDRKGGGIEKDGKGGKTEGMIRREGKEDDEDGINTDKR